MSDKELYKTYQEVINYIYPGAVQAFAETKILPSIAIGTAVYYLKNKVITTSTIMTKNNVFNTLTNRRRLINYDSIYDSIIEKYNEIKNTLNNDWFASYKDSLDVIFNDKPITIHEILTIIDELGLKDYDKLYMKEYINQLRQNGVEVSSDEESNVTNLDTTEEEPIELNEGIEADINNKNELVIEEEDEMKDNIIEAEDTVKLDRDYWTIYNTKTGETLMTCFCLAGAIKHYNAMEDISPDIYIKDKDGIIVYPKDSEAYIINNQRDSDMPKEITYTKNSNIIIKDNNNEIIYPIHVKNINVYKSAEDKRPFRSVTGDYYIMGEEKNKRTLLVRNYGDISPSSIVGWVKTSKL